MEKFTLNKASLNLVNGSCNGNVAEHLLYTYNWHERAYTELCINEIGYYITLSPMSTNRSNEHSINIKLYKYEPNTSDTIIAECLLYNSVFTKPIVTTVITEYIRQAYSDYNGNALLNNRKVIPV